MTNWVNITKEQFDVAYNKHLPNAWTKLAFRYFSTNTLKKDMYVRNIMKGVLLGLFGIGFIGTILSLSRIIIGSATIAFSIILLFLGIFMFGAFIMNNFRINKIIKELGITKEQYNILVENFYS
jgi:hypothetical protein